jgi:hypothetical protein
VTVGRPPAYNLISSSHISPLYVPLHARHVKMEWPVGREHPFDRKVGHVGFVPVVTQVAPTVDAALPVMI